MSSTSSTSSIPPVSELIKRWAVAAVAASGAEAFTLPLDVAKTRLQLQGEVISSAKAAGESAGPRLGMMQILTQVYRIEGPIALYAGLGAAVLRQAVYGGIGVGLYPVVRRAIVGPDQDPATAELWCVPVIRIRKQRSLAYQSHYRPCGPGSVL